MSLVHCYCDSLTESVRLFDGAFAAIRFRGHRARMDIHESKDANTVTATFELPGMKPDNITIDIHKDRLTVAGEAKKSRSHEKGGYAVRERSYGKFSRKLRLPFATKGDNVKAKIENGVLTVTFPKTTPEQQA